MFTRPVWAEISRSNLLKNYQLLWALAGPEADLLTVVKANAYGHGLLECAPLLVAAGASWIGVTSVEEGVCIRAVCPEVRILVMSGVWRGEAEAALEHRLTPVVWEQFHIDLLEAAVSRVSQQSLLVHVEIDTGMSRQGVRVARVSPPSPDLTAMVARFHPASPLRVEALMTHFTAPEELDDLTGRDQMTRFESALIAFAANGVHPQWISAGNSANLLGGKDLPELRHLQAATGARLLVRPGLALYGYSPRFAGTGAALANHSGLRPVLQWKTRITSLRTIEAGDGAGYNSTFRAARPTRLALLPCGYADGISRLLSNRGRVLVRGKYAPIAGRVSMDQTIVDVTDIPGVETGDEVVLIGSQGELSISACDIADLIGTIPYEVLCDISSRVPRVLVD